MGFNGGNVIDIDKLTNMLEDHRDLLNDITNKETCKDGAAALPKLLFDLVSQSEENIDDGIMGTIPEESAAAVSTETDPTEPEATSSEPQKTSVSSAKEIVDNLPKVWKVLIELLNHQKAEKVSFNVSAILCSYSFLIKVDQPIFVFELWNFTLYFMFL